jgi:hypothetical protein
MPSPLSRVEPTTIAPTARVRQWRIIGPGNHCLCAHPFHEERGKDGARAIAAAWRAVAWRTQAWRPAASTAEA